MPFEFFPNTNFHDMNLDYILEKTQKIDDNMRDSQASADAAKASEEAAKASEDAAKLSEENAKASEEAAKDYADNIADPVSGLVTDWLEENITQETGYVLDASLTSAAAAAPAKTVGDKALWYRGSLNKSANLDDILTLGTWFVSSSSLPVGWPFTTGDGRLIVYGSASTGTVTKMQIAAQVLTQKIKYRLGATSGWKTWVELATADDLDNIIRGVIRGVRTESIKPTLTWEQGGFTTSSWSKWNPSSASNANYVRLVSTIPIEGIQKVRVTVSAPYADYRVFVGCQGWTAPITLSGSSTITLTEADKTELNLTMRNAEETAITPEVGAYVTLELLPNVASVTESEEATNRELDGIVIPNTSAKKIGLYGASIVVGYGTSDFNTSGDLVELSTIGYTNMRKNTGTKCWAAMFTEYITATYPNITVENWAVGGATSATYYDMLKKSLDNGNTPLNTDVDIAIIMLGNNGRDLTMAENVSEFMNIANLFKNNGTDVYFVTPTPAFSGSHALNTYQIMQCSKEASRQAGVASVDGFAWIENYCNLTNTAVRYDASYERNFLNSDNLHPGDLGHEIIFKALKNLLKI